MKIGYFPGCSLEGSSREYGESLKEVAKAAGIELVEVPDWNCCGATAAHSLNHELAIALSARILAIAENEGLNDLLVPCSACYSRLATAKHELEKDSALRQKTIESIKMKYEGKATPYNVIEFLKMHVMDKIKDKIKSPFNRKVACYYGCLLVRPPKVVKFDRPEDPVSMDEIMGSVGATPVDWAFKTECCGAGLSISRTDLVGKLSAKILNNAEKQKAEAVIVACPMCHVNLDMRRDYIEQYAQKTYKMPVIYITQAIGMALGIDADALGLHRHFQPVEFGTDEAAACACSCGHDSEESGHDRKE